MKKYLLITLLLLSGLFLVSCKKDKPEDKKDETPVTNDGGIVDFSDQYNKKSVLRVWIDDENQEYMAEIIKEFNKENPNIIVEHQHMGSVDSRENLKTFGPSGNGADVFQFPHDHMAQAVLEDLVLQLPAATAARMEERIHEIAINIGTLSYNEETGSFDPNDSNASKGLYGVPMSIEAVGLFYNKKLLGNTPVAASYEELITAAKIWNALPYDGKAGSRTNAQEGNFYLGTTSHWADSYFMQHIYSAFEFTPFGPELNDPSSVGFNKLKDALAWIRDDLKPITTGDGKNDAISGGSLFEDGKIPYVIGGPWNHQAFIANNIDYGVAPLPTIKGKETQPFTGAMMAAVYKYSNNKEDAIKFVEFLASDIAMELQFKMKSKLPALKASLLANIDGVLQDTKLMAMSEQLKNAVPMPTIPQVQSYWGPGEAMIKKVWNDGAVIADAVAAAEAAYLTSKGLAGN